MGLLVSHVIICILLAVHDQCLVVVRIQSYFFFFSKVCVFERSLYQVVECVYKEEYALKISLCLSLPPSRADTVLQIEV